MTLINFRSKINTINSIYTAKLDLQVQKTDINTLNIDNSFLEIYDMVIIIFHVLD